MTTDFERDVSAAFHRAADQLPAPRLDVDAIRRAGGRRRMTSFTVAALVAAVLAAGAATVVLQLPSAPSRAAGGTRPRPPATTPVASAAAMADVQAFYRGYPAAASRGQAAVDALISTHMAGWYAPIAEAQAQPGGLGDCFGALNGPGHGGLRYAPAVVLGGQAIIVVSSSALGQVQYAIVTADQSTGKITGLACTSGGQPPTKAAYARGFAASLYYIGTTSWLSLRRQGDSSQQAVARIVADPGYSGGPESGSPYLLELQRAALWPELTYDPLLCTSAGLPNITVTAAAVVADGEAGVVELTPAGGQPVVAVWVVAAKGYAVASVACHQP
jgi:hypothetical protein